jgi:hypothetical protein
MNEGQELVEAPVTDIQPFNQYEAEIVQFEKYFDGKEYDLTTEEGIEVCEADKLLLRKVEIRIEKTRKTRGADLLKATKELNASAKVCHNRVHVMWGVVDKPLAKIRQAKLDAEIDAREKEQDEANAAEAKHIADLEAREAKLLADEAKLNEAQAAIDEKANVAQRKKDIAEAATAAAEKAVSDERARAHKEKNDRIAKDLAEKNAADDIEAARKANVEHCKEFNNLALDAIIAIIDDPATSLRLVKAIVKGEIPNVSMNY